MRAHLAKFALWYSPRICSWSRSIAAVPAGLLRAADQRYEKEGFQSNGMVDRLFYRTSFALAPGAPASDELNDPFALVVLNHDLPKFLPFLWNQAGMRVCADGGANRIFDELPGLINEEGVDSVRRRFKPDVIKGDLDSIRPTVREFYSNLGTRIIDESHDQDTTDFEKCIAYIKSLEVSATTCKVVVVGALGGRFDHVVAHINVLHKFPKLRITLLGEESLVYLLPQGFSHEIHINSVVEGPHCGLIPFYGASESTTTTGLRWNLNGTAMAFGSLVSTSNLVDEDRVTVTSDVPLIWTIALQQPSVS